MKLKISEITCSKDDFLSTFELIKNNQTLTTKSQKTINTCIKYYSKKLNLNVFNENEMLDTLKKSDDLSDLGLAKKIEEILELDNIELRHYLKVIDSSTLYLKVGLDGKIISSNNKFAEVAGYSIEELIGVDTKTLSGNFSKERPKEFWKNLWDTVLSGNIWQGKIKNITINGDYYRTETTIIPKITNGKIEYFTVIRTDITESEHLKTEIIESNIALKITNGELIKRNMDLEILSTTDSLTGLNNRRSFDAKFLEEFNRANRDGTNLSLVILDIDFFKNVNDTYGHDIGDIVIKTISEYFKTSFRIIDFKFRLGGEEFALLSPNTSMEEARALSEKFRGIIERINFNNIGHITEKTKIDIIKNITVSIGISCYNNTKEFMTQDTLFKKADEALYLAKQSGRNNVKTCEDFKKNKE